MIPTNRQIPSTLTCFHSWQPKEDVDPTYRPYNPTQVLIHERGRPLFRLPIGRIPRWKPTCELLGKGAQATVQVVIDQWQKKAVAAKTNLSSEELFELAKREQRNYQQLRSVRHLNGFYGGYQSAPLQQTLILELAPPTLDAILEERGPLPFADVVSLTRQLLETYHDLSKAGWIHGDLKPDNVSFKEGKLRVLDLGHAYPLAEQEKSPLPVLDYQAPEICLEMPCDGSVDLWSIACTVYEAYMGESLFLSNEQTKRTKKNYMAEIFNQLGYPDKVYRSNCPAKTKHLCEIPRSSETFWHWKMAEKGEKERVPKQALSLFIALLGKILRYTNRISAQEGIKMCQQIEAELLKPQDSCLIS